MAKPGDQLTTECEALDSGVLLTLFNMDCTDGTLEFASAAAMTAAVPTLNKAMPDALLKQNYINFLGARGIVVCDQETFAVPGSVFSMRLRKTFKCPWYLEEAITFRVHLNYDESISPSNNQQVNSNQNRSWDANTIFNDTFTSGTISPGYPAYGSSRKGSATLKVEVIDANPDNTCNLNTSIKFTSTLVSLGLGSYENMDSIPQSKTQSLTKSCASWLAGGSTPAFFWVGVKYPIGPIGLVQSLLVEVFKT